MPWVTVGMRAGHQRNQPCDQRAGTSGPILLTSRNGRGPGDGNSITKGQRFNQWCLCNDAFIKMQKESIQVGAHVEMWGSLAHLERAEKFCTLSP